MSVVVSIDLEELLSQLFHCLDPSALFNASHVCRLWQIIAKKPSVWKPVLQYHVNVSGLWAFWSGSVTFAGAYAAIKRLEKPNKTRIDLCFDLLLTGADSAGKTYLLQTFLKSPRISGTATMESIHQQRAAVYAYYGEDQFHDLPGTFRLGLDCGTCIAAINDRLVCIKAYECGPETPEFEQIIQTLIQRANDTPAGIAWIHDSGKLESFGQASDLFDQYVEEIAQSNIGSLMLANDKVAVDGRNQDKIQEVKQFGQYYANRKRVQYDSTRHGDVESVHRTLLRFVHETIKSRFHQSSPVPSPRHVKRKSIRTRYERSRLSVRWRNGEIPCCLQ
eukprot:GILK01009557.1.p1 GENE.GILK01009557.1~~GILK01009557.1.p1  ORF type:complete len:346 (-),score=54.70 GILK01009557.1:105-1106(-)